MLRRHQGFATPAQPSKASICQPAPDELVTELAGSSDKLLDERCGHDRTASVFEDDVHNFFVECSGCGAGTHVLDGLSDPIPTEATVFLRLLDGFCNALMARVLAIRLEDLVCDVSA